MEVPATPELDKLAAARKSGGSQEIGAFLEWLDGRNFAIGQWYTPVEMMRCSGCSGSGIVVQSERRRDEHGYSRFKKTNRVCPGCEGMGEREVELEQRFMPVYRSVEAWLAEYFGVDLDKVEQERRAILEAYRQ